MIAGIIRNVTYLLGAEVFSKLINIIFFAFLARHLSVYDSGIYITLLTYISFGLFFSDPGLSQTLIRNISQDQSKASVELKQGLILSFCFCLVVWVTMVGLAYALYVPEKLISLLILSGIFLGLQSWAEMMSAFIRSRQRMDIIAIGNSISLVLSSSLGIYLLLMGFSLVELMLVIIFQGLFSLVFFGKVALRLGLTFPKIKGDLRATINFLKDALPLGILIGCGVALNRIDLFMISQIKGMSDTAIYGMAVKLIDSLSLISSPILAVLFPFFSSRWGKSVSEIEKVYAWSMKFFLILGLLSAVSVSFFSKEIINLFFGPKFIGSALPLNILIWSFLFYMMGAPLGIIILIERNKVLRFLPYAIGVVIFNILLNFWLISRYSYVGASVSTFLCSVILFKLKIDYVNKYFLTKFSFFRVFMKPFLSAALMFLVLWLTKDMGMLISLLVGVFAFIAGLHALGELKVKDLLFGKVNIKNNTTPIL